MTVMARKSKIAFELPRKDFEPFVPRIIKREVQKELRKRVAVQWYARGEVSEEERMHIPGSELTLGHDPGEKSYRACNPVGSW